MNVLSELYFFHRAALIAASLSLACFAMALRLAAAARPNARIAP